MSTTVLYQEVIEVGNGAYAEEMSSHSEKVVMFTINATWLRRHPTYSVYYVMVSSMLQMIKIINTFKIGNFLIMSLIPVVLLTVLNYLIYRKIRRY